MKSQNYKYRVQNWNIRYRNWKQGLELETWKYQGIIVCKPHLVRCGALSASSQTTRHWETAASRYFQQKPMAFHCQATIKSIMSTSPWASYSSRVTFHMSEAWVTKPLSFRYTPNTDFLKWTDGRMQQVSSNVDGAKHSKSIHGLKSQKLVFFSR